MNKKRLLAGGLSVIMALTMMPARNIHVGAAAVDTGKLITHYDMTSEDGKLKDVSGGGHDATLVGFTENDFVSDGDKKVLSFTGDNTKYVKLPDGAVGDDETFTIETTFFTDKATDQWLYCLGTKEGEWPNVKNYLFLNPNQSDGKIRFGIKNSETEVTSQTGSILTGKYNTVTMVCSAGQVDVYLNGGLVGTKTHAYSVQDILRAGVTDVADAIGYIGKSLYTADKAFTGKLADFKVYNYSFTAEEINAFSSDEIVSLAKTNLSIPNADDVRGNITLPKLSKEGAAITWESSDPSVVTVEEADNTNYDSTPAGVVTRQAKDTGVTLTATISAGKGSDLVKDTKAFKLTVKAKPKERKDSDYTDYLFTHFIGEGGTTKEQIYFSASRNGFHWTDLNDGESVLTSNLGDGGVRDPYILRSAEGDRFYIIATDLCIGGGTTWTESQTNGSKSLIIWESNDLVNWSEPRMVEVGVKEAGCVWAPEAVYDEKTGEYMVFWASMVKLAGDTGSKQRIYCAKTRDFYTFSEPQIYIERANHIIDTTIIEDKGTGTYYRYSKDETTKVIGIDSSKQLLHSTFTKVPSSALDSLKGVEGPLIYKLNSDDSTKDTWCLMADQFAVSAGYLPLVTNDLSSGTFTKITDYNLGRNLKRHGSVLRLTAEEYQAIQAKWKEVKPIVEKEKQEPVISYDFEENLSGATVKDASGNKNDATLHGSAAYVKDSETKSQVLYLNGNSGTYAEFPANFFTGRNTFTLSMDMKSKTTANDHFTFTIGKNDSKYMFLRTKSTQLRNAITTDSYSKEEATSGAVDSILNKWTNITLVIKESSMAIYQDGLLLSENNKINTKISDLGRDLVAYVGKSFYSADPYFNGYFDNIKVYNRALNPAEIARQNGAVVSALKGASAKGYRVITSQIDKKNRTMKVFFSRSNSTMKDLTSVPLKLDVTEGCTLKTDISKGVNLNKELKVEVEVSGESKPQVWTVTGVMCNNSVLAGEYADPDIDVFDGTYYMYPTTDGFSGWSGTKFHVFSSKDMTNWKDHGVILDVATEQVPWAVGSAWAPTIEKKNGKYYFYFCAKNSSSASCIGVATANSPTGPFTAEKSALITPKIASEEGIKMGQTIDPSVFTDDNGTSYLLFGNGSPAIVELNADMISIKKGTMKNLTGLKDFREAVTVTKRKGIYHFTWSCDDTGSENYHVNYGTSNSLYGPVTYKYTVLAKDKNKDILGTGHHSIINVPGTEDYYIAYHRFYTPLGEYNSGLGYHRETCIDKVDFDDKTNLMKVIAPTLEGVVLGTNGKPASGGTDSGIISIPNPTKTPIPTATPTSKPSTDTVVKVGKVKSVHVAKRNKNSLKLTWSKVKKAKKYIIYRYDRSTKKYKKVGEVKKNSYTDKGLKAGTTYQYKITGYTVVKGKKVYGDSAKITVSTKKIKLKSLLKQIFKKR